MKVRYFILVGVFICLVLAFYIHENKPTTAGHITAKEYVKMLGVGINVDWMSFKRINEWYFYWRSKGVNIPLIFKRRGFRNVRIRVGVDVVNNPTALKELNEVVNDCLTAGIIPIIAYSAKELRENPNQTAIRHFLEWWKVVAENFKGKDYRISFDLIIETSGKLKDYPKLNELYNETINEIRKVDKYRIIIVTPPDVSSPFALNRLRVKWDPYIIAEWHIYAGGPKKECPSCPIFNKTYIEAAVKTAEMWSRIHSVPTWMGAWRPNRYPKKHGLNINGIYPMNEVEKFASFMVSQLRKYGIPYDINSDAKFFNIEKLEWYPSQKRLLDIILGS